MIAPKISNIVEVVPCTLTKSTSPANIRIQRENHRNWEENKYQSSTHSTGSSYGNSKYFGSTFMDLNSTEQYSCKSVLNI